MEISEECLNFGLVHWLIPTGQFLDRQRTRTDRTWDSQRLLYLFRTTGIRPCQEALCSLPQALPHNENKLDSEA